MKNHMNNNIILYYYVPVPQPYTVQTAIKSLTVDIFFLCPLRVLV